MFRKIGWLLILASIVAVLGELFSLQLPTLRWPFNVSREFFDGMPKAVRFILGFKYDVESLDDSGASIVRKEIFPVFGYLISAITLGLGVLLLIKFKRNAVVSPITERRIKRFKSIGRGYVSLIILGVLCLIASFDHLLVGNEAIIVKHDGEYHFPALTRKLIEGKEFGLEGDAAKTRPNYRKLKIQFAEADNGDWVLMPLVPYAPTGDTTSQQSEALEVGADGKIYDPGSGDLFSGIATRLYDINVPARMHSRVRIRDGVLDGDMSGWDREGALVYTANYSAGELTKDKFTGENSTKEAFLNAEGISELREAHLNPAPPLPQNGHLLGTTSQGNDVLAYLYGGLQVNIKAALLYIPIVYAIGVTVGLLMGFFGGAFDLIVQRLIEIFSNVPFLFVIIIISSSIPDQLKSLGPILLILIAFGWMGMTYLMRTAALKEKARDYVAASRVIGCSTPTILFRHILPNTVAILVTLVPFSISGLVVSLTSLDYLGFGLPAQYATWGRLLQDGLDNLSSPWLAGSAFLALVTLLILVTFVGEAIREAFDPKKFTFYR